MDQYVQQYKKLYTLYLFMEHFRCDAMSIQGQVCFTETFTPTVVCHSETTLIILNFLNI